MQYEVTKRDGRKVAFDKKKIIIAITKAMQHGSGVYKPEVAEKVADSIAEVVKTTRSLTIEQIEDMVYMKLIDCGEIDTAKAYEGYRAVQEFKREENTTDESILSLLKDANNEVQSENSNKDSSLVSTKRDLMAGIISEDIVNRFMYPSHIIQAHKEGVIHLHK